MSDALTMEMDPALSETESLTAEERAHATSVWIVAVAGGLMAIGAVMTFSASTSIDHPLVIWPVWETDAIRQLAFVTAGLLAMLLMTRVPYTWFSLGRGYLALILLILALGVASLVFVPGLGVASHGAYRWLKIPGTTSRFQPSELVKGALPIFIATWTVYRVDIRKFWTGLVPMGAVIALCAGTIGIEDFGTAALLALVAGGMLLVAGAKIWHLLLLTLPAVPAFGYLIISKSHRVDRLTIFLDPFQDATGKGYQIIQSLCTIISGGWWGRGLGNGFVKGYLPEARNDFIFAVICEELGIVGGIAVIGLLLTFLWLGRSVVFRCPDPVGRLLAFGIVLMFGIQAAMNIAVVTASVPTKGIALPLVSAGGSGTVFLGGVVGVLASIARHSGSAPPEKA
ncbi:MAG TPA: putative peptidoglycan glycosyltransferase FtsW [Phycisphaerae bacterium]|nr:putative peptidoglycan glycosyltransferase FtsW [Phycisphaerae bacterium]